jgi:hypothetical protein
MNQRIECLVRSGLVVWVGGTAGGNRNAAHTDNLQEGASIHLTVFSIDRMRWRRSLQSVCTVGPDMQVHFKHRLQQGLGWQGKSF